MDDELELDIFPDALRLWTDVLPAAALFLVHTITGVHRALRFNRLFCVHLPLALAVSCRDLKPACFAAKALHLHDKPCPGGRLGVISAINERIGFNSSSCIFSCKTFLSFCILRLFAGNSSNRSGQIASALCLRFIECLKSHINFDCVYLPAHKI